MIFNIYLIILISQNSEIPFDNKIYNKENEKKMKKIIKMII